MTTRFIEAVTLSGAHATLLPLERSHEQALRSAAADGELWKLWYTSVPAPDRTAEWIGAALEMRERQGAMPFVVRANADGGIVGSTRYFNVDAANRRLEIGHTWYAKRAQRSADQHRMQAAAADARLRGAAVHRRRVPHALLQFRVARRDRAAGGEAGRNPAQSPGHAGRHPPRHRRLQRDRKRVAEREAQPAVPARSLTSDSVGEDAADPPHPAKAFADDFSTAHSRC